MPAPRSVSLKCGGIFDIESKRAALTLSARGYDRVRKVARTIADLNGDASISGDHVAEALQFRMI